MHRSYFSKIAIFLCVFFLLACNNDKGVQGFWHLKEVQYVESKEFVTEEDLKGISYEFREDGTFEQRGQNGEVLPGKYKIFSDTMLFIDTITNISYAYKYKLIDNKHLTMRVFNSMRNEEMELSLERGSGKN